MTKQAADATEDNPTIPRRNDVYYLDSVIFQVEDELFKVPRYYFERHSEIFESMFALPPPVGQELEGSVDSAPLRLDGVNKVDFQALLEAIFPFNCTAAVKSPWDDMPKSKWISVLKLATLWIFKELRAGAISRLTRMMTDPIEQVLVGKEYSVPQWLHSGYAILINRKEMLSLEEARRLNFQTAFLLCQAREEMWSAIRQKHFISPSDIIERCFKEELQEILVACAQYEVERLYMLV